MGSFPLFGGNSNMVRAGAFNDSGGMPLFGGNTPGSNQYYTNNPGAIAMPGNTPMPMSTPGQPGQQTPPGIVPPASGAVPPPPASPPAGSVGGPGAEQKLSGGNLALPTFDPAFTNQFYAWLQQQLGQGATPFNLSAILPSTGKATDPGTLTAPLNPIEQSLEQFYKTGSADSGPMPGVMPMWNAARAAMEGPQGPIETERAKIRGQFAFGGNLASSPFAESMTRFGEQTALDENALLTSMTMQALPQMQQFGGDLQKMDQSSINNMLAEFIRTRPEYSPLLNEIFGGATSSPGVMGQKTGIGPAGAILSGAGEAAGGVADLIKILKGG